MKRKQDNFALTKTKRSVIKCGKGMTEQSQKISCDINHILRKYQQTGTIEHAKSFKGKYDDVTVNDFTEAMNLVTQATDMFNELPSSIRTRTGSPAGFLEFIHNPENQTEMLNLGLIQGNDGLDRSGNPSGAPTEPAPIIAPAEQAPAGQPAQGQGQSA